MTFGKKRLSQVLRPVGAAFLMAAIALPVVLAHPADRTETAGGGEAGRSPVREPHAASETAERAAEALIETEMEPEEIIGTEPEAAERPAAVVPVFLTDRNEVAEIPLEDYVRGVVAGEMPVEFELEALKAQAIAARTYAVRRLAQGERTDLPPPAAGAAVTDTTADQVYVTEEELRAKWGMFEYARKMEKLSRAVKETEGIVLTYGGEPIEAVFFSMSNGFTENSEEVWQEQLPYLRSVKSPWEERYAPDFERETELVLRTFYEKMGLPPSSKAPEIAILERTEGGRAASVSIAGRRYTGREVRERLGLPSADFDWRIAEGRIIFRTRGSGHGVGLSQWGANGMAKEGHSAEEILLYYYKGAKLEKL